jgi:acyl-CoA thioesterase FadM
MVLGTMTAEVLRLPRVDERCVVVGRLDQTDDRRSSTSTALYDTGGTLLARAEAIWVRVDPDVFNRLTAG